MGLSRKHRHVGNPPGVQQPAEVVDQLLGPLDGEDRDDDVAARGDRLADHVGQLRRDVAVVLVVAVAVGRFHHDVVGLGEDGRVADDRLVPLADVAGEDEPPRLAVRSRR